MKVLLEKKYKYNFYKNKIRKLLFLAQKNKNVFKIKTVLQMFNKYKKLNNTFQKYNFLSKRDFNKKQFPYVKTLCFWKEMLNYKRKKSLKKGKGWFYFFNYLLNIEIEKIKKENKKKGIEEEITKEQKKQIFLNIVQGFVEKNKKRQLRNSNIKWKKNKKEESLIQNLNLQSFLNNSLKKNKTLEKKEQQKKSNQLVIKNNLNVLNILSFSNYFFIKNMYFQKKNKKNLFFYFLKNFIFIFNKSLYFFWLTQIFIFKDLNIIKLFLIEERKVFSNIIKRLEFSIDYNSYFVKNIKIFKQIQTFNEIFIDSIILKNFLIYNLNLKKEFKVNYTNIFDIMFKLTFFITNLNFKIFFKYRYDNSILNLTLFFISKKKENLKNTVLNNSFNSIFYLNKLKYFLKKNVNISFSSFFFKNFLKSFNLNSQKFIVKKLDKKNNLKFLIWKRANTSLRKYIQLRKIKKKKKDFFRDFFSIKKRDVSSAYLYFFKKIENKLLNQGDALTHSKILQLRNLLFYFLKDKIIRSKRSSGIYIPLRKYWTLKNDIFEKSTFILKKILNKKIKNVLKISKNLSKNQKISLLKCYLKFFYWDDKLNLKKKRLKYFVKNCSISENNNNISRISLKKQLIQKNKPQIIKFFLRKSLKRKKNKLLFKTKKIVAKNSNISFKRQKEFLFAFLNRRVSIFYINALSLTRFAYIGTKSSNRYIQNIEREMIYKFKYIAIYIQDLVRIGFISLFLKKATFLANFIAFQLEKLPKNRKETKFIRFIIKLVKISAAQRKEMTGLRIKFKGRVNRWRRTKSIVGTRGIIHSYTYNTRIEYGSSKAITRKGALGISIWFAYKPIVKEEVLNSIINYQKYSKILRWNSLTRYFYKFLINS